ncbi:MAG: hypothetical protein L6R38_002152 [Xanthoria sp. 2 TBL-2021]|nr:MAG: hypothetical protein L6R38_002152 [Xanthoria sp. 2 TBL-2021]
MDENEFGQGISPIVFDSSDRSMDMHDVLINTYGSLSHLTLHMGTRVPVSLPDLTGLGDFLGSLLGLEYLELFLPAPALSGFQYTYDQIFDSKDGRWPKLHTLSIHNLAIGTKDLVSLFSNGLPSLRNLIISVMVLLDGRWEWIIQFMHEHMRLDEFQTSSGAELMYSDGGFYQDDNYEWYGTEEYDWLLESVQSYVVRCEGHKHPSNRDDSDDDTVERKGKSADELARRYSKELQKFLR